MPTHCPRRTCRRPTRACWCPAGCRGRSRGVIDFGDLTASWAVAELAVTLSSLLFYAEDDDLSTILPAVRAFDRVRPISDDELAALWPLVVLRAAALLVGGQHRASIDRDNAYVADNLDRERRILEQAVSVPADVMITLIRSSVRAAERPPRASGRPMLPLGDARELDLCTTSPLLHDGAFLTPRPPGAGYVPYLQPRLTRTVLNSATVPATVGLGVEVFADEPLDIDAPWPGASSDLMTRSRSGATTGRCG